MMAGAATPADPVRVGIIGCGRVLTGPYRPVLRKLLADDEVVVTIACDVQLGREASVRAAFAIDRFTTAYRSVLDADDVDLVMILTPPASHAQLAIDALEAGKHVLVEKPLALAMRDADRILDAARATSRYLVCAPFVTLSPTYQAIQEIVRAGRIGRVLTARSIYGWAGPDWGPWFYRGQGGGPLFDLGVYNLTTLTGLIGPVRRVTAISGIGIPERVVDGASMRVEVDDSFQILLDFGDAVFASLTTGFTIQQLRTPAVELYGSTGTIQMLGADWQPDGYEIWENEIGAWTTVAETSPDWSYMDGLRHLVVSIRNGTAPSLAAEHAVHVLELMLLAIESSRDGRTRELATSFTFSNTGAGAVA
jgi:predicted dehydrogenase